MRVVIGRVLRWFIDAAEDADRRFKPVDGLNLPSAEISMPLCTSPSGAIDVGSERGLLHLKARRILPDRDPERVLRG